MFSIRNQGLWLYSTFEFKNFTKDGKRKKDADGKQIYNEVKLVKPKTFPANVFNVEQMDGVPEQVVSKIDWDANEKAEKIKDKFCTSKEQLLESKLASNAHYTVLWSSKEAVYKGLRNQIGIQT